jgi:hypothetical protein
MRLKISAAAGDEDGMKKGQITSHTQKLTEQNEIIYVLWKSGGMR